MSDEKFQVTFTKGSSTVINGADRWSVEYGVLIFWRANDRVMAFGPGAWASVVGVR